MHLKAIESFSAIVDLVAFLWCMARETGADGGGDCCRRQWGLVMAVGGEAEGSERGYGWGRRGMGKGDVFLFSFPCLLVLSN